MPEIFAVTYKVGERYPVDRGPVYYESDFSQKIVEPWNAGSAMLFVFIALFWLWRLRGRYREFGFLACCQPILLTGGIGGTLYHAFRSNVTFFLLDVIPIQILGLAVSIFFCFLLRLSIRQVIGAFITFLFVGVVVGLFKPSPHVRINISYALLGTLVVIPILLVLRRTQFVHGRWILMGLISFAIALYFRFVDARQPPPLPMGTHWLWHTFGAITTFALSEYVYRLTRDKVLARTTDEPET